MSFRNRLAALRNILRRDSIAAYPDLDVDFYRAANPDVARLDAKAIARHYELFGRKEGRFPNATVALRKLERGREKLPADFDPQEYRRANPDIASTLNSPWASIQHYLTIGRAEGRAYFDFDVELYKALHFGIGQVSDEDARKHYEIEGRRKGLTASWAAFLSARGVSGAAWATLLKAEEFAVLNWSWCGAVSTKLDAVNAMLAEGIDRLAPIAFDLEFEPAYYREAHPELGPETDVNVYKHWLFDGLEKDEPGSSSQHLRRLRLDLNAFPEAFQWRRYAKQTRLRNATRWSSLDHFIRHGVAPDAAIPVSGERSRECLTAFAEAFAARDDRLAIRIGELTRPRAGKSAKGVQALADCYYRQERWEDALVLYRRVATTAEANVWTVVNGVRAALKAGLTASAFELLSMGRERVAGDPLLRAVVREAVVADFDAALGAAEALYLAGRRDEADAHVSAAVERTRAQWATLDPIGAALPRSPYGPVVILANTDIPQCTRYRVDQKAQLLKVLGREHRVFSADEVDDFISALPGASAAIFYRLAAFPMNVRAIEFARAVGVPTYFEVDDLIFERPYPEPYETFGGSISPEVYAGLQLGVPLFKAAMTRCEFGIASTTALAQHMAPLVESGRVFVVPNGLDDQNEGLVTQPPRRVRRDADVVVFYGSGTKAHNSDFLELAGPALADIMRRREDVRLIIVGYLALDGPLAAFADRIIRIEFTSDVQAFYSVLAEADINLAVLSRNEITDAKSEIKWLEAAVLAIPSIVSDTATFREVVQDGVEGLIAGDVAGWRSALERLVSDADLRRAIGAAAREKAARLYSAEINAQRLDLALRPALEMGTSSRGAVLAANKPRILLVNAFFPPQSIGGATRVVHDNIDQFLIEAPNEFDFAVVASDNGVVEQGRLRVDAYRGVPVFRLSTPQEVNMDWRALNSEVGSAFEEILEMWSPDLVHFHAVQRLTASTLEACVAADVPYVVTVHDAWWVSDYPFLVDERGRPQQPCPAMPLSRPAGVSVGASLARRRALRDLLAQAEAVLGVSDTFAKLYRDCGHHNTIAVPNGVSTMPVLARVPPLNSRVRMAHVGGQTTHKGYDLVQAALKAGTFANLELTVVDHSRFGGEEYHQVWGGTSVRIVGKTLQEQMHTFYAGQDVVLAPSIWPESFGLVVREALRAGLWVVASDRGATGEDIRPGVNGFIIDVATPHGLFETMAAIDRDPARYMRPPPAFPLRTSLDQARDLLELYRHIAGHRRAERTISRRCGGARRLEG